MTHASHYHSWNPGLATNASSEESSEDGPTRLASSRHNSNGTAGHHQMESRPVSRAIARIRQMGVVNWRDFIGVIPDRQGM